MTKVNSLLVESRSSINQGPSALLLQKRGEKKRSPPQNVFSGRNSLPANRKKKKGKWEKKKKREKRKRKKTEA